MAKRANRIRLTRFKLYAQQALMKALEQAHGYGITIDGLDMDISDARGNFGIIKMTGIVKLYRESGASRFINEVLARFEAVAEMSPDTNLILHLAYSEVGPVIGSLDHDKMKLGVYSYQPFGGFTEQITAMDCTFLNQVKDVLENRTKLYGN